MDSDADLVQARDVGSAQKENATSLLLHTLGNNLLQGTDGRTRSTQHDNDMWKEIGENAQDRFTWSSKAKPMLVLDAR